jgi:hypothetical protein
VACRDLSFHDWDRRAALVTPKRCAWAVRLFSPSDGAPCMSELVDCLDESGRGLVALTFVAVLVLIMGLGAVTLWVI